MKMTVQQAIKLAETVEMLMEVSAKYTAENVAPAESTAPAGSGPESKSAYTIHQAAEKLACSPSSIRKFIRQRRLARLEGFRKILIPAGALEKFVQQSSTME